MDKLGIAGSSLVPRESRRKDKKVEEKKKTSSLSFKSEVSRKEDDIRTESAALSEGLTGLEKAEDLLDDVYQLGEDLKQDANLATLKKYKAAVKKFYKYVVTRSLEAAHVDGRLNPKTMSRKQYTLISVVDEQLEKLGAAVLRSQKDQLNILKKIDEIYGILVDLTR
ncbi:MAG: YaaR family protein [Spirochaetales bacterium]|nr:YaaR family protein [Spirochaetales bacterium]